MLKIIHNIMEKLWRKRLKSDDKAWICYGPHTMLFGGPDDQLPAQYYPVTIDRVTGDIILALLHAGNDPTDRAFTRTFSVKTGQACDRKIHELSRQISIVIKKPKYGIGLTPVEMYDMEIP